METMYLVRSCVSFDEKLLQIFVTKSFFIQNHLYKKKNEVVVGSQKYGRMILFSYNFCIFFITRFVSILLWMIAISTTSQNRKKPRLMSQSQLLGPKKIIDGCTRKDQHDIGYVFMNLTSAKKEKERCTRKKQN